MNYNWLTDMDPTVYGSITNDMGQIIEFVEHPLKGETSPVICLCRELEVAEESDFFDTDDMMDGGDYMPFFIDGKLQCKFEL